MPKTRPTVSVIISNRNDTMLLAITVRSALEELSVVPGGGEVVIVDNSDQKYHDAVKSVIPSRYLKNEDVRLYYQGFPCLFTAREEAARQARGEYIICVDSHCLFGHGSILNAVNFMNRNGGKPIGFGSLPINWLCQHEEASKHDMEYIRGGWGKLYKDERKISWKGMPWISRRNWFLNELGAYGALSQHKMSWGGGDMYLGVKTWLLGYENWAIPSRAVIHVGPMPIAARKFHQYRLYQASGEHEHCLGFLVAFYALGATDDFFDRPNIDKFLVKRVGAEFKSGLGKAKELASVDRKRISRDSIRTLDELEANSPWIHAGMEVKKADSTQRAKNLYQRTWQIWKSIAGVKANFGIKKHDWDLFRGLIKEHKIKTVLEFGSGLSTILFDALGLQVDSFETDSEFMQAVGEKCSPGVRFFHWDNEELPDGITLKLVKKYDLGLVDGIMPRFRQAELCRDHCKLVVVHDIGVSSRGVPEKVLPDWNQIPNLTKLTGVFSRPS